MTEVRPQPYRVREYTLDPGEAISWHRHTQVSDYYYGLEGMVQFAKARKYDFVKAD
jgi:mannose-6-phosphate isomerase-like protein (cupin superfamily)